jgi:hypothetical protein
MVRAVCVSGQGQNSAVNLGSVFLYTDDEVEAVASGIMAARETLRDRGGFRVLWKLPKAHKFKDILNNNI